MTIGPSIALTSPPASAHPAAMAAAPEPALDLEHVLEARARGCAEGCRAPGRGRAHGGQVGERDRERPGAETARADPRSAEVHAFHQGILADGDLAPGIGGPHGGVVSGADHEGSRCGPCDLRERPEQVGSPTSARVAPPSSKPRSAISFSTNVTRPQYTWPAHGVPCCPTALLALGLQSSLWCGGATRLSPTGPRRQKNNGGCLF